MSKIAPASRKDLYSRAPIGIMAAIFFIAMLPFLIAYVGRTSSETFYRDGAIRMIESGDYLTPQLHDGSIRLRKPVIPYWFVTLSYKAFGVSNFSSRLPFLLAGCMVIWLACQMARIVSPGNRAALATAAVMISHPTLMVSSVRSIPDILLCLFMTISAWGCLGMLLDEPRRRPIYPWLAYVGAGLAVMTKGMLPLLFLAVVWGVSGVRLGKSGLRRMIHPPAIIAGIGVMSAWYILMYFLHGDYLVQEFWGDQVGSKVRFNTGDFISDLMFYVGMYFVMFLPWSIPAAWTLWRRRSFWRNLTEPQRNVLMVLLCWCLAMALLFAFGKRATGRYLLPASPLLAVLIGAVLSDPKHQRTLDLLHRIAWRILATVSVLLILASLFLIAPWRTPLLGIYCGGALWLLRPKQGWLGKRGVPATVQTAVALMLIAPLTMWTVFPLLVPDESSQLVLALRSIDIPSGEAVLFAGSGTVANGMRMQLHGEYHIDDSRRPNPDKAAHYRVVIGTPKRLEALDLSDRPMLLACRVLDLDQVPRQKLSLAILRGKGPSFFRSFPQEFWIALAPELHNRHPIE